jgi:hypothetical protein
MTYLDRKSAGLGPRTHAIVIGVNHYPHLIDGEGELSPATMGLEQLTSPVLSAVTLSEWMEKSLDNPDAPLDTIELLLSPSPAVPSSGKHANVDRATMANIKAAFGRWYNRCDSSADNVALFYFCGHGIEPEGLILLPEDFGADKLALWDSAIDMTRTYYGMAECKARTQCYFIDACREQPIESLVPQGVVARPLKTRISTAPVAGRKAPFMKSAPLTQKSFAIPGQVSYFTRALVDCLDGLGAAHFDSEWWHVTTDSLMPSINRCMERVKLDNGTTPQCSPAGGEQNGVSDLHRFRGTAPVLARIACDPSAATQEADLLLHPRDGESRTRPHRAADPWETVIPSGNWRVEARFPSGGCPWSTKMLPEQLVYPPFFGPVVRLHQRNSDRVPGGYA